MTLLENIAKALIGNALHSAASNHVVAVASDIYDEDHKGYQSEINEDIYTKLSELEANGGGGSGAPAVGSYTKTEIDVLLANKADSSSIPNVSNKADKATTLSGYGITDAYTKAEVDALISASDGGAGTPSGGVTSVNGETGPVFITATSMGVYTKTVIDEKLNSYAKAEDVNSTAELAASSLSKANEALAKINDMSDMTSAITGLNATLTSLVNNPNTDAKLLADVASNTSAVQDLFEGRTGKENIDLSNANIWRQGYINLSYDGVFASVPKQGWYTELIKLYDDFSLNLNISDAAGLRIIVASYDSSRNLIKDTNLTVGSYYYSNNTTLKGLTRDSVVQNNAEYIIIGIVTRDYSERSFDNTMKDVTVTNENLYRYVETKKPIIQEINTNINAVKHVAEFDVQTLIDDGILKSGVGTTKDEQWYLMDAIEEYIDKDIHYISLPEYHATNLTASLGQQSEEFYAIMSRNGIGGCRKSLSLFNKERKGIGNGDVIDGHGNAIERTILYITGDCEIKNCVFDNTLIMVYGGFNERIKMHVHDCVFKGYAGIKSVLPYEWTCVDLELKFHHNKCDYSTYDDGSQCMGPIFVHKLIDSEIYDNEFKGKKEYRSVSCNGAINTRIYNNTFDGYITGVEFFGILPSSSNIEDKSFVKSSKNMFVFRNNVVENNKFLNMKEECISFDSCRHAHMEISWDAAKATCVEYYIDNHESYSYVKGANRAKLRLSHADEYFEANTGKVITNAGADKELRWDIIKSITRADNDTDYTLWIVETENLGFFYSSNTGWGDSFSTSKEGSTTPDTFLITGGYVGNEISNNYFASPNASICLYRYCFGNIVKNNTSVGIFLMYFSKCRKKDNEHPFCPIADNMIIGNQMPQCIFRDLAWESTSEESDGEPIEPIAGIQLYSEHRTTIKDNIFNWMLGVGSIPARGSKNVLIANNVITKTNGTESVLGYGLGENIVFQNNTKRNGTVIQP